MEIHFSCPETGHLEGNIIAPKVCIDEVHIPIKKIGIDKRDFTRTKGSVLEIFSPVSKIAVFEGDLSSFDSYVFEIEVSLRKMSIVKRKLLGLEMGRIKNDISPVHPGVFETEFGPFKNCMGKIEACISSKKGIPGCKPF